MSPFLSQKAGIGLRQEHWGEIRDLRPKVGFLEIHAENFLGGHGWEVIEDLRQDYPFSVHAVGFSIASADGIDLSHLQRIAALVDRLQPALVSDHLCWSRWNGLYLNDLIPFPYTQDTLHIVADNIQKIQDILKRPLLIENLSSYIQFSTSDMSETQFLAALVKKTGCGLLCDVNNLVVNAYNHGGDVNVMLSDLPTAAVGEIHLAGHTTDIIEGTPLRIDTHSERVADEVWHAYAYAARLFPQAPSLIEWDANIPDLAVLLDEARKADVLRESTLHVNAA